MDLFKIQSELIADRSEEGWYRMNIAGPFFHYRWSFGSGPEGAYSHIASEHHSHAVCREEPSLTMSWGMEVFDRQDREELQFEWAQKFVTKTVRPFWVDFFWNNALIDRVELCRVDGGHGTVPLPDYGKKVTDFEVSVAFLICGLEDGPEHDNPGRYIESLGFERVRDRERWGAGSS